MSIKSRLVTIGIHRVSKPDNEILLKLWMFDGPTASNPTDSSGSSLFETRPTLAEQWRRGTQSLFNPPSICSGWWAGPSSAWASAQCCCPLWSWIHVSIWRTSMVLSANASWLDALVPRLPYRASCCFPAVSENEPGCTGDSAFCHSSHSMCTPVPGALCRCWPGWELLVMVLAMLSFLLPATLATTAPKMMAKPMPLPRGSSNDVRGTLGPQCGPSVPRNSRWPHLLGEKHVWCHGSSLMTWSAVFDWISLNIIVINIMIIYYIMMLYVYKLIRRNYADVYL